MNTSAIAGGVHGPAHTQRRACCVMAAIAVVTAAGTTRGDDPCPSDPYLSRCTNTRFMFGAWQPSTNELLSDFRLNLSLLAGPGPAELPPRSVDPTRGSYALVSADARLRARTMAHPARPTHAGTIDLVTGVALHQEMDFELPFGGAVFRHIRTNADNPTLRFNGAVGSHQLSGNRSTGCSGTGTARIG